MKMIENFPDDPGPDELKKLSRFIFLKKQAGKIDPANAERYTDEADEARTLLHFHRGSTKK